MNESQFNLDDFTPALVPGVCKWQQRLQLYHNDILDLEPEIPYYIKFIFSVEPSFREEKPSTRTVPSLQTVCAFAIFEKIVGKRLKFSGNFLESRNCDTMIVGTENLYNKIKEFCLPHNLIDQMNNEIRKQKPIIGFEFGKVLLKFLPHCWDINILNPIYRFLTKSSHVAIVKFKQPFSFYIVYTHQLKTMW